MMLSLLLSAAIVRAQDGAVTCPCTNNNEEIPEDSPMHGSDYGTSCRAWDAPQDYCDPDTPGFDPEASKWCQESWCYVSEQCVVVVGADVFRPVETVIFDGASLWWSYETCGSPDYYNGAWNFTFTYPEKCVCQNSNVGNPDHEGVSDYGKYCKAWDNDFPYCDPTSSSWADSNKGWCPEEWCYVQKGCVAELNARNWTSSVSVFPNTTDELYWSYETCGSSNFFAGSWAWDVEICPERPPLDVYILVDSSGSVWNEWPQIQQAASTMVNLFNATFGDRVSMILFGGTGQDKQDDDFRTVHKLSEDLGMVADSAKNMELLKKQNGGTHQTWTYGAINYTFAEMDSVGTLLGPDSRPENRPMIILITDGRPYPIAVQDPCDPEINHGHPRSELVERDVKVLVFEVRRAVLELDCLVDDPAKDIFHVADPADFFNGVTEDFFCVKSTEGLPTAAPTCADVEMPPPCQAGPQTTFDSNNVCQVDFTKVGNACGIHKSRLKKGVKTGGTVSVDESCTCEAYCMLNAEHTWWSYQKGKCQCYKGNKAVIHTGNGYTGKIRPDEQ